VGLLPCVQIERVEDVSLHCFKARLKGPALLFDSWIACVGSGPLHRQEDYRIDFKVR
jgi:hypothetical protein